MPEKYTNPGYGLLHENTFNKTIQTGAGVKKDGTQSAELVSQRKSPQEIESLYIANTDGLVGALDGSISSSLDEDSPFAESGFDGQPADFAIYLDKSARPIRTLVHGLWPLLSQPGSKEPVAKFLNIDKEVWLQRMDIPRSIVQEADPSQVDINKLDTDTLHDHLTRIRALFVTQEYAPKVDEDNLGAVWDMPTIFDDKNVAIVDEVRSSGNTLRIALQLLKRAFPETTFSGVYWSTPPILRWEFVIDNEVQKGFCASYVPVWYNANSPFGRGIDDIDQQMSEKSDSKAQRVGQFILGTRYHDRTTGSLITDELSQVVRNDIALLCQRAATGQALVRPSPYRDYPTFISRAEQLNRCKFPDFKNRLHKLAS